MTDDGTDRGNEFKNTNHFMKYVKRDKIFNNGYTLPMLSIYEKSEYMY